MDVAAVIAETRAAWVHVPGPADPSAVADLAANANVQLPIEYLDLLRLHDGGEGELAVEPGWFQLWPTVEVLAANREYQLPELLQSFFGFGSSGGGELLALDCRSQLPWPVVMVPFIPLDATLALPVAADFGEFVRLLGRASPGTSPADS